MKAKKPAKKIAKKPAKTEAKKNDAKPKKMKPVTEIINGVKVRYIPARDDWSEEEFLKQHAEVKKLLKKCSTA